MFKEYSWMKLQGDVSFKGQNYRNSCFAAAYQNLCANLNLSYRSEFTGYYYGIEKMEADYMSQKHSRDIDKNPPDVDHVNQFLEDQISRAKYSNSAINFKVNSNILLGAGQPPDYSTGYILNAGDAIKQHACAFFVKNINGTDYYIYLNSEFDYRPTDFKEYAQPCNMGMDALKNFDLCDDFIHGGAIVLF